METPKFELTPVKEKPSRKYRKGSKYDEILKAFEDSKSPLSVVKVGEKDANYMRTQLNKRILALTLPFKVSVTNGNLYLEKTKPVKA